jgi:aminoglycoside 3-N-acetyltransferase
VLARLIAAGGRVLRLGANDDTVTVLHHAEYLAELPDKRRVRRYRRVATPTGPEILVIDSLDDEHGLVDYPGPDYFAVILGEYRTTGRVRTGPVGSATAELLEAGDLVRFGAAWMEVHLGPLMGNNREGTTG